MDAAFPYGFAFSMANASSKVFTLTIDKMGPKISSVTAASCADLCKITVLRLLTGSYQEFKVKTSHSVGGQRKVVENTATSHI